MNLRNSLSKLGKLSLTKLEHLLQLQDIEIENYTKCIRNYSPEKFEKSGKPFLERLNNDRKKITEAIEKRKTHG